MNMTRTSIPRSIGHKHAARFGDISPPGIDRLWSSSAHRAPFRLGTFSDRDGLPYDAGDGQPGDRFGAGFA